MMVARGMVHPDHQQTTFFHVLTLEKPKSAHFNRLPGPGQWLDTAHLFLVVTIWYVVAVEKQLGVECNLPNLCSRSNMVPFRSKVPMKTRFWPFRP